jgi:hypothetical protein
MTPPILPAAAFVAADGRTVAREDAEEPKAPRAASLRKRLTLGPLGATLWPGGDSPLRPHSPGEAEAPGGASTFVEAMMAHVPVVPRTARAVVDEHRMLRALLAQVEEAFERPLPRAASGPDVVAARLDTLRGPLGAHFEEEERARLFEEIEELAPEQAPVCARLRDEHARLIHRLDSLREASPEARRAPAWLREVRALLADLARHEAHETDLLSRTLDGSIAAGD